MLKLIMVMAMVVGLGGASLTEAQAAEPMPNVLRHFLQDELKKTTGGQPEMDTVVHWATVPLANGGQEFVILLSGDGWCGTGGCTLFVYEAAGASFKEIGHSPAVRQPIRVLDTVTNGRPDLGAWRSWSDTQAYETRILFNGRRYLMEKEAVSKARSKPMAGETLIGETDKGMRLYGD
ncbi:MAG TPA: hypothetical protein VG839_08500 [Asticcacaulis sp.]|nr:hypothetical protein [Asticcacaulis sp.]